MFELNAGDGSGYGSKCVDVAVETIAGGVCIRFASELVPFVGGTQVRFVELVVVAMLVAEPLFEPVPPIFFAIMFLRRSRVCWEIVWPEPEKALKFGIVCWGGVQDSRV